MANPVPVGLACRVASERDVYMQWLRSANYAPVPLLSLTSLARHLDVQPLEALVADAEAVSQVGLSAVQQVLTGNRPLVIIGKFANCPPELRHVASWLDRPVSASELVLGLALALAEGRPARRSARKNVLHLPATVDGVRSEVLDVSNEGVRLKVQHGSSSPLPPYFTLRVEMYGVATVVQRAWTMQPNGRTVLCGGTIHRVLPRSKEWTHLVSVA
jgi:hypothetical protein